MEFILDLSMLSAEDREKVGDKAVALSQLMSAKFPVPEGFVITNAGFHEFAVENKISESIIRLLQDIGNCGPGELAEKSKKVRDLIISGKIPKNLKDEIKAAYASLGMSPGMQDLDHDKLGTINAGGNNALVAVRSSVCSGGSKKISFRGFYKSYLHVSGLQGVIDDVKASWANIYSDEAIFARQKYNGGQDIFSGIIIQKMIDGEKSGMCSTANPVTNNVNEMVVESSFGCGLVPGGEITPDVFIIDKTSSALKGKKINPKEWRLVKHAVSGDVLKEKVSPELTNSESLLGDEIVSISNLAKSVEAFAKYPVYIEWVFKRDKLYLVDVSNISTINKPLKAIYESSEASTFNGIGANSGSAEGLVVKVHCISDVMKVRAGNIFVVPVIEPSSILVLNRVGGVVSENGGLLSDMSILCRELDIPLVVSCQGICEGVVDGTRIVLDATAGKVYVKEVPSQGMSMDENPQEVSNPLMGNVGDTPLSGVSEMNNVSESTGSFGEVGVRSQPIPVEGAGQSLESGMSLSKTEVENTLNGLSDNQHSQQSAEFESSNSSVSEMRNDDLNNSIDNNVDSRIDNHLGNNIDDKINNDINDNVVNNIESKINDNNSGAGNMIEDDPLAMITGTKVKVLAGHLNKPEEVFDGIGLFPSELVLLNLGKHPDKILSEGMEDEFVKYLENKLGPIVESSYPKPVTFRTLSAQTSTLMKLPEGGHEMPETNPKLGWRGIRRTLDSPAIFKAELKALNNLILKGYKNIEILLPFVHHPQQVYEINNLFKECGIDMDNLKVGISVEVPAAGLASTEFVKAGIDFVFIDSDRLAEHMLGIDSSNEKVNKHFDAKHPGVLRMIKMIIDGYKKNKVPVSVGGSMLNDSEIIEKLVEFGVDAIVVPGDKAKVSKYIVARAERKMLLDIMRERGNN
ncbi:MAG: hypothetical protein KAI18_00800 [Candidatus Aenigmarchaeota archaeon]|nr:hypothetical protein [Candidatus Aenigmarchaeota archaeon]